MSTFIPHEGKSICLDSIVNTVDDAKYTELEIILANRILLLTELLTSQETAEYVDMSVVSYQEHIEHEMK